MLDIVDSLLLAGIASLITLTAGVVSRRIRDKRLGRRYPVAGRFVTEYDDTADGEKITRKGFTILKQRGRHITGETIDLQEGRSWILSGTVEPGGFVHGIYGAEDPHDTGTGTFFLKIGGRGGDLTGLWAGYDSVNGGIDGGKYVFRRSPDVTIREAVSDDAQRVCALLGQALGELYIDLDAIRRIIAEDETTSTCFVAVSPTNQLLGAVTTAVIAHDELASAFPIGHDDLPERLLVAKFNEQIGIVKSIAVDPKSRSRGIATQLVDRSLEWQASRGATASICVGWKSDDGCHIAGVMEVTGFDPAEDISAFWLEESKREGYLCPACGHECHCGAIIFSRSVDVPDRPTALARVS